MLLPVLLAAVIAIVVVSVRKRASMSSPYSVSLSPAGRAGGALTRSPLHDKLDEWIDAELIDLDEAEAVLAYETERAEPPPSRLPLAAEAVGYIGSGLVLASVALLIGNRWDDISTAGRIASLAVPTVVAVAAGWWTGGRDEPPMQRLGSILWLLAVAGAAGVAAEIWVDAIHSGDAPDHGTALFIGLGALALAAPAWLLRHLELQQLALFGASITTALGVIDAVAGSQNRTMSPLAAGLTLLLLGGAWLAISLAGRLPPPLLANLSGAALVLVSAQIIRADNDHAGLWLGLTAAGILLVVGVVTSEIEVLLVGTAGLFQWTPQIALFYLEDVLGAEATLFVIGTLLLVLAGLLTRLYPWVSERRLEHIASRAN